MNIFKFQPPSLMGRLLKKVMFIAVALKQVQIRHHQYKCLGFWRLIESLEFEHSMRRLENKRWKERWGRGKAEVGRSHDMKERDQEYLNHERRSDVHMLFLSLSLLYISVWQLLCVSNVSHVNPHALVRGDCFFNFQKPSGTEYRRVMPIQTELSRF